jgi:glycosyltransferase involved in cell wall biosynthesis
VLPGHYGNWRADLLITLMDAWVLNGPLLAASGMRAAHWMPVDAAPLSVLDRNILDQGKGRPVAMSRFGETQLAEAGYGPLYVPHCQDMTLFKPLGAEDRARLRAELGYDGRFVVGIAAANQDPCRKGFGEQFTAYAQFRRAHPEALLVVHSRAVSRQGSDLRRMAATLGLAEDKDVIFGDQYGQVAGTITDATMAKWYGVLDVLSNCSYGEGFGCPVLDAQACGTPVVVSGNSTGPELCGAGWQAECEPYWNRGHSAWWGRPKIDAIVAAYEEAFAGAAGLRGQAREFALAYDADTVARQYWVPALAALEASRETPKPKTGRIFATPNPEVPAGLRKELHAAGAGT